MFQPGRHGAGTLHGSAIILGEATVVLTVVLREVSVWVLVAMEVRQAARESTTDRSHPQK